MRLFFDLEATLMEKDQDVTINKLMDNDYHINMKANENMIRVAEILSNQHEIYVLTPKINDEISNTKENWVYEYASFIDPDNIIYYTLGYKTESIPFFDQQTDILFDDYIPNLEKWSSKEAISFFVGNENVWNRTINPYGLPGVTAIQINREMLQLQETRELEQTKEEEVLIKEPINFQSILAEKTCENKTVILNFISADETFEKGIAAEIVDAFPQLKNTLIRWQYVLNQKSSLNKGGVNTCKVADNLYVSTIISKENSKMSENSVLIEQGLEKLNKNNILKNAIVYAPLLEGTKRENIDIIKKQAYQWCKEAFIFKAENHYEHKDRLASMDVNLALYNEKQLEQLRDADKQGIDVAKLLNPKWDHYKMQHIKIGLGNGIDLTPYADQYTSYQLKEIRNCLMKRIPIDHFTPEMKSQEMHKYFLAETLSKDKDNESLKKITDTTYEAKKLQRSNQRKELIASIKEYPILSYAEENGFTVYRVGKFYGIKEYESVRIKPWANTFVRYSQASQTEKGHKGSIIDFVMEVENLSQKEAIEKLIPYASVEYQNHTESYQKYASLIDLEYQPTPVGDIELPEQKMKNGKPDNRKIINYLTVKRELNFEVVDKMIKDGMLYEDTFSNCVFVTKDTDGKPIFACRRGTNDEKKFKQDLEGCDYNQGFYIDNGSDTLIITEGVIEIMSLTSFPTPDDRYKNKNYLSLNSTYKLSAVFSQLDRHPEIKNIKLALNNDSAGKAATDAIIKQLEKLDWKGELEDLTPSTVNDYNDLLVNQRRPKRELIAGTRLEKVVEFKDGYFYKKDNGKRITVESVIRAREKLGIEKTESNTTDKNKMKTQDKNKERSLQK